MAKDIEIRTADINRTLDPVPAKQNDHISRILRLRITDEGKELDLTNCSVILYAKRPEPDGTVVSQSGEVIDGGAGLCEFDLKNYLLCIPGKVRAEVAIYGGNESVLTTRTFIIDVEPCVRDETAIESMDNFSALTEALGKVTKVYADYEAGLLKGDPGKPGDPLAIIGRYNTIAALQAAHPAGQAGQLAVVDGIGYIWLDDQWKDIGPIGIKGDQGEQGEKGDPRYMHIRYRTSDSDTTMLTTPDVWIGIFLSTSPVAPTTINAYNWYRWKGDTGDTGGKGDKGDTGASGKSLTVVYLANRAAYDALVTKDPLTLYVWGV